MSRVLSAVSVIVVVAAFWHFYLVESVWADQPNIRFDVASVIQCADLVDPLDKPLPMDGQLVLIPLSITTDLDAKARKQLREIKVEIQMLQANNEIFDYLPQTATFSDIQGPVNVEVSNEKSASLNLNVSGSQDLVRANGNLGGGTKNRATRRYSELPKQQVVSATGTMNRRTGVFFKFMKSSQIAWDVERHISIIVRVPENWRAGMMRIDIVALGKKMVVPGITEEYTMSDTRFHVPFVRKDDADALRQSRDLVEFDSRARKLIVESNRNQNLLDRSLRDVQSLVSGRHDAVSNKDLDRWLAAPKVSEGDRKRLRSLNRQQQSVLDEFLIKRRLFFALNADHRLAKINTPKSSVGISAPTVSANLNPPRAANQWHSKKLEPIRNER